MEKPQNLDKFLKDLLTAEATDSNVGLDDEGREFIEKILSSITHGSQGVFVVLHPNDKMQYMLLNTSRMKAIGLLARILQRTSETLEEELD